MQTKRSEEASAPEGFLLIDKSAGMTSHDVVDQLRKITGIRRIGHAGTLDPFATGLLVIGIGRGATKHMQKFVGLDKEYESVFVLGARSETDDIEGTIHQTKEVKHVDRLAIQNAMKAFIGEIEQIPPTYSAIKIGGKKMYEQARKGKPLTAKPRKVRIDRFELERFVWPRVWVRITCGSGTYVRALARDVGEALGVGGYVEMLRRTRIGPFRVKEAHSISELEHKDWSKFLIPVNQMLTRLNEANSS